MIEPYVVRRADIADAPGIASVHWDSHTSSGRDSDRPRDLELEGLYVLDGGRCSRCDSCAEPSANLGDLHWIGQHRN
ncbi:hypothetical protein ASE14_12560 [Agromyces sp. Root81]|nr:hypothetical protein ASE14_12560 [Agromyces sp. Root81]